MGSPSTPPQPAPESQSQANADAVYAQVSTLPTVEGINQAAQLGTSYTYVDPTTGQTQTADFSGLGNLALAQQAANLASTQNAAIQQQELQLRQQLGVPNVQETVAELQAADPTAYQTRNTVEGQILNNLNTPTPTVSPNANLAAAANSLGSVNVTDPTNGALNSALTNAQNQYALGTQLDPAYLQQLTNQSRAAEVARGNYTGDASAVAEATNVGQAALNLQQQRLQNLLSVQQQAFGQGTQLQQQQLGQAQAEVGAQGAVSQNQLQALQASQSLEQQKLANAQSITLGQPITNQFGSLAGAQQGAVGYQTAGYTPVSTLNPSQIASQGDSYATNIFGTQGSMYNTQAQIAAQGNPWMSVLGSGIGALGSIGAAAMI